MAGGLYKLYNQFCMAELFNYISGFLDKSHARQQSAGTAQSPLSGVHLQWKAVCVQRRPVQATQIQVGRETRFQTAVLSPRRIFRRSARSG